MTENKRPQIERMNSLGENNKRRPYWNNNVTNTLNKELPPHPPPTQTKRKSLTDAGRKIISDTFGGNRVKEEILDHMVTENEKKMEQNQNIKSDEKKVKKRKNSSSSQSSPSILDHHKPNKNDVDIKIIELTQKISVLEEQVKILTYIMAEINKNQPINQQKQQQNTEKKLNVFDKIVFCCCSPWCQCFGYGDETIIDYETV